MKLRNLLTPEIMEYVLAVNTLLKRVEHADQIFRSWLVLKEDRELSTDLILLDMSDYGVSVGMDWLSSNQTKI